MTRRSTRDSTRCPQARTGAALLEVIIALAILVTVGAAITVLASESAHAVRLARDADAESARASAFLDAVALWPRADLDRHLGVRTEGRWRLRVDRPAPALYVVTLTDTTSKVELLRTALFRPEPSHANQ